MNKVTLEALKNIYVWLPARIEEVGENSLLKIQPLTYNEDLPLPIINDVPVEHIGNERAFINIKVNKGDIGIAIFSQMDLSNFMETGELKECDTDEIFNLTNCSFLPLKKWNKQGTQMPSDFDFEIVGNIKHTGKWVHDGDYERNGNTIINGNVYIEGTLTTKILKVIEKAVIKGVDFFKHTHKGVTGGKDNTGEVNE